MTSTYERETDASPAPPVLRRRRRVAAAVGILALLVGVTVWVVGFTPLVGVRSYAVRGVHVLAQQQVLTAAHIPRGTPLVRVDTDAAAARVERLPDVASATVETSFPSTVVITVVERTPVGYVESGSGHYVLVDRTGDQYRTVTSAPPKLPVFVVPSGKAGRASGAGVATVAAALPQSLLRHLASIQALDPGEITLVLRNGRVVRWGSAARSTDKARVLSALVHRVDHEIDVSDPDQPFTR